MKTFKKDQAYFSNPAPNGMLDCINHCSQLPASMKVHNIDKARQLFLFSELFNILLLAKFEDN